MKYLGLATIFAALSGFLVLIVAGWTLGESGYAQFQAYWGLFFALTGLIDGITHETTRGAAAVREGSVARDARPWRVGFGLSLVVALVMAATSPAWMGMLVDEPRSATALMTVGLLSYTFQAVLSGVLSGAGLWGRYSALVALDSGVRLALTLVAWLLGWGLVGFLLITAIGAASWLAVLRREDLSARVDVSRRVFVRRTASAMAASGASAALITGFPTLLQATAADRETLTGVTVGAVMMAISFTRAPILVPVQRFQTALISRFVAQGSARALAMPIGIVLLVGLAGAGLAWLVGPWLMVTVQRGNEDFWVSGGFLAVLTFASACAGSLMITGAAALAREQHALYVGGWVVATLVAFLFLLVPLPLELSVGLGLILGPVVGGAVHASALRR